LVKRHLFFLFVFILLHESFLRIIRFGFKFFSLKLILAPDVRDNRWVCCIIMGWSAETQEHEDLPLIAPEDEMEFSMSLQQERERYEAAVYAVAFKFNPLWLTSVDHLTQVSLKMVESELLSKEKDESFDLFGLEEYRSAVKDGSWKYHLKSLGIMETNEPSPLRKSVVEEVEELSTNPLLFPIISSIDQNLASSGESDEHETDDFLWKHSLEWVQSVHNVEESHKDTLSYPPSCSAALSFEKLPTTSEDDLWKYHKVEHVQAKTDLHEVEASESLDRFVDIVESTVNDTNDTIDLESYPPLSSVTSLTSLIERENVEASNSFSDDTSGKNLRNAIVNSPECESIPVVTETVPEKVTKMEVEKCPPPLLPSVSSTTCNDRVSRASTSNTTVEKIGIATTCALNILSPINLSKITSFAPKKCDKSDKLSIEVLRKKVKVTKEQSSKEENFLDKRARGCVHSNILLRPFIPPSEGSSSSVNQELWKTLVINVNSICRWNPDSSSVVELSSGDS